MKASEISFNMYLSQPNTKFVIPVYQRDYNWTQNECKKLVDDVLEAGSKGEINSHFVGSIVHIHDGVFSTATPRELTIIDGQQRITTIVLMYIRLYKLAYEIGDNVLKERIYETFLINKFTDDASKIKLKSTDNNSKAIEYLLRNDESEEFKSFSKIIENYNYLESKIVKENYEYIINGLNKLVFVEVSLERDKDDPQRIFESLNSTGLDLTQADLIRNFILMKLTNKEQIRIYNNYWSIIENLARDENTKESKVSELIRDYLTIKSKKIPLKAKVYQEFRNSCKDKTFKEIENELLTIKTYAKYYNKLLNPERENDKQIQIQVKYINKLEIIVSYPFILQVYDDFSKNVISKDVFIKVLEIIQSFVWRRFVIELPTNALNKIFMRLYDDIDQNSYIESLQKSLLRKKGIQRFPSNSEVLNSLKIKDFYNIKSKNRTYLLERLENYNNKEYVVIDGNSDITIEHIFPRNPDLKWQKEMDKEEYKDFREKYIDTIANLTLSGNNGRLGNKTFLEKRDMIKDGVELGYKYSRLWLNRFLSEIDAWNKHNLDKRFKIIIKRFNNVWEYPNVDIEEVDYDEVNIFDIDDPTGKKLEYAIFMDQNLKINTITGLFSEILVKLFELQPEVFFTSDLGERLSISKNKEKLRNPIKLSETYFIENNSNSKEKFERIKYALNKFELEDELIIKLK